jgi:hypothetical protein
LVQPTAAIQVAPQLLASAVAPNTDPLAKQDRFASSLYIRPPPSV